MEIASELTPGESEAPPSRGLERLIFFSDAVMAIAMTLLALDLRVPTASPGATNSTLWHSFLDNWSDNYLPYVLSFVVIAIYWSTHHRLFLHIVKGTTRLTQLNFLFLFLIVTLPFATRFITESGSYQVATVLYAVIVAAIGLTLAGIIALIWSTGLQRPGTPKEAYQAMARGLVISVLPFVLSIPIAFYDTTQAKYSWVYFSIAFGLIGRIIRVIRKRSGHASLGSD